MKAEDIRVVYYGTTTEWQVRGSGDRLLAGFFGDDAQQYAEEHAQKLRDKLPKPRWVVDRVHELVDTRSNHGCVLHHGALKHAQAIADLLNELEP